MSKSKILIDKLNKLIENGMLNSKDFTDEIKNILKFKQEEMVNKLNFVSRDEFEIQKARLDKLEKKIDKSKKEKLKR